MKVAAIYQGNKERKIIMIKFLFGLIFAISQGSGTNRNKVNKTLTKMNEDYGNWFKIYK